MRRPSGAEELEEGAFHLGDNVEVLDRASDGQFDCVLTSPPYNFGKRPHHRPKAALPKDLKLYANYDDDLPDEEYLAKAVALFRVYDRVVQRFGTVVYVLSYRSGNASLPQRLVVEVEKNTNWRLVELVAWVKSQCVTQGTSPTALDRLFETCYVFARKDLDVRRKKEHFLTNKRMSKRDEKTGQAFFRPMYNVVYSVANDRLTHDPPNHATFPVALVEQLLDRYVPVDRLVLDPFAGTGTTAVACRRTGRRFCCVDVDPASVKYARERFEREFPPAQSSGRARKKKKAKAADRDSSPEEEEAAPAMEHPVAQDAPGGMEPRRAPGVVTASRAAQACGASRYGTSADYWRERREGRRDPPDNADMAAGRLHEEAIAQNAARLLGYRKLRTPGTWFDRERRWLAATPDRIIEDGEERNLFIECKHSLYKLYERPQIEHVMQVTVGMALTGTTHCYLAYGNGPERTRVFRIEFDDDLWEWMLRHLDAFKRCLEDGTEPTNAVVPQLGRLAADAWEWVDADSLRYLADVEKRWARKTGAWYVPPRPRWRLVAEQLDGVRRRLREDDADPAPPSAKRARPTGRAAAEPGRSET